MELSIGIGSNDLVEHERGHALVRVTSFDRRSLKRLG